MVITTHATFDEESFPQCFKGQEDRPAPIPIPDDQESEIHQPKSPDCHEQIPIPVSRGNSPQPPPLGFYGYRPFSEPSEPSEPSEKDMPLSSPNSLSPSQPSSKQHLSPTKPGIKRRKPDSSTKTGLDNIHQKKRYLISDSPPIPPTPSQE